MSLLPSQSQRTPAIDAEGLLVRGPVSEGFIQSAVNLYGLYNARGLAERRRETLATVHLGFRSSQEAGREATAFAQLGAQKNVGHERYHGARA
jgi:hypothetical protein